MTLFDIFENYHITPQFPPAVQKQLKNLPDEVQEKDLKGRLDLTELLTFTIDGDDAKDFDDAVSLEKNEKGNMSKSQKIEKCKKNEPARAFKQA